MTDEIFWWTGVTVWLGISAVTAWLVFEIFVGFVCAISWCRWAYAVTVVRNRPMHWLRYPPVFMLIWRELIGHRNKGKKTWRGKNGYWQGIGDWAAIPDEVIK